MGTAIGLDIGTSGTRAVAVAEDGTALAWGKADMPAPVPVDGRPAQDPQIWLDAALACLAECVAELRSAGYDPAEVEGIAAAGTSGTMLICDASLRPLTPGLMYNSGNFDAQAEAIDKHAPPGALARGHSSGLARLLYLQELAPAEKAAHVLHQADWVLANLCATGGNSDTNNALKAGCDPASRAWPDFVYSCGAKAELLPQVHEPGTAIGLLEPSLARKLGLPASCTVRTGTTDSIAAFLASGAAAVGHACSSLGTTLAVKLLAAECAEDLASGVYSHRIGGAWLPGGASNTGGAVLLQHFSAQQLEDLEQQIKPERPTGLDYYPLPAVGERFPINDASLKPRLEPRPPSAAAFCQAIMEGIAAVEKLAYERMAALGAPVPSLILTAGGGAASAKWTEIRQRTLGIELRPAASAEAAVGAARLARGPLTLAA